MSDYLYTQLLATETRSLYLEVMVLGMFTVGFA